VHLQAESARTHHFNVGGGIGGGVQLFWQQHRKINFNVEK